MSKLSLLAEQSKLFSLFFRPKNLYKVTVKRQNLGKIKVKTDCSYFDNVVYEDCLPTAIKYLHFPVRR